MPLGHRTTIATSLLVGLLLAATPAVPAAVPVALPAGTMTAGVDVTDLRTAFDEDGNELTPTVRATAEALAAALSGTVLVAEEADEAEESGVNGTARLLDADTDGDGVRDVFSLLADRETGEVVRRVLSGADGSTLQEHHVATSPLQSYAFAIADHTGDGVDDEIDFFLEDLTTEGCEGSSSTVGYSCHQEWRWVISLRDGATGDAVWTRVLEGRLDDVHDEDGRMRERVNRYPGVSLWSAVGVGATTLHSDHVRIEYRTVDGRTFPIVHGSATVEVRDGNGAVTRTLTAPMAVGEPVLVPSTDHDGDGAPEHAWVREVNDFREGEECPVPAAAVLLSPLGLCETTIESDHLLDVELHDGADGSVRWSTVHDEQAEQLVVTAYSMVDDLDGDGTAELVATNSLLRRGAVLMFAGGDGTLRWRTELEGNVVLDRIVDVDGDGDADVTTVGATFGAKLTPEGASFATSTLTLAALDGDDGTTLHAGRHEVETPTADLVTYRSRTYAAGDLDGDGIDEQVHNVVAGYDEDGEVRWTTEARLYRGSTGEVLLDRSGAGHRLWETTSPIGDGALVLEVTGPSTPSGELRVDAVTPGGVPAWSSVLGGAPEGLWGDHVLVADGSVVDGHRTLRITRTHGPTGSTSWSRSFG